MTHLTYWTRCPRGFHNEYAVGIATTAAHAEQYEAEGYDKTGREIALHDLSKPQRNGEQLYVSAFVDGIVIDDRLQLARAIRSGGAELRRYLHELGITVATETVMQRIEALELALRSRPAPYLDRTTIDLAEALQAWLRFHQTRAKAQ